MPLPRAVQEQITRANVLSDKLKAGQPITVQDIGPPVGSPTNPTQAAPIAAPTPVPVAAPVAPAAPSAPAAPAVPAATPAPAAPAPVPTTEEWQHRYSVLQGKYNAEVPRLHQTNRDMQVQLQTMQNQLVQTQALLAQIGQQPQAPITPARPLVSPDEVKAFGADLTDFVSRVAQQAVFPQVSQEIDRRIAPVAQRAEQSAATAANVAQRQQQTSQDVLYTQLDTMVPTWETVNNSPEFLNWLNQEDPLSGQIRGSMLASAFQNGNAPRVAGFFNGFLKENAALSPAPGATPAATAPAAALPAVSLTALAAPGTGVGGPQGGAPNDAGQRLWTLGEIAAFYRDVQTGKYRGRDNDRVALEKDIFLAQKTGRVRAR